ncbi:MAG TPA: 5'/3'-nucleotidase SurE [Alphaproteobacteria bacterium]|nr:5'/3'-nucleotidase SurE [Alphaproteobacteria bacterium]
MLTPDPHPLRLPRILLTNDDGFEAPGLAALTEIAETLSHEVWVVAPQHDESGTGQSLSLHHPLRAWPRGERRWAVGGTPGDCVALALGHFMADTKPALLLSGINAGSNLGDDVNLSGTIGAALIGLLLGVPSIAISMDCVSRDNARWDTARAIAPKVLSHFLAEGWRKDTCLSINIPDLPANEIGGFRWARPDARTLGAIHVEAREDLRAHAYYWLALHDREPGPKDSSDRAVLNRGEVAVTALSLDRSADVKAPAVMFDEWAEAGGVAADGDMPADIDG